MARDRRVSAKFWLEFVREIPFSYGIGLDSLRMNVEEGGFSLADIGTSESELEKLRVDGCRAVARVYDYLLLPDS